MNADVGRPAMSRSRPRLHHAWVVALVTFAVLLVTVGGRQTTSFGRLSSLSRRRQLDFIDYEAACKSAGGFGIVRRKVDRRTIPGELPDSAERGAGHVVIGADAVDPTDEHQSVLGRHARLWVGGLVCGCCRDPT